MDSFQQVMKAPHLPLVVIAAVTPNHKDKVAQKIQDVATLWNRRKTEQVHATTERDVVFTWMDAETWSTWLKNMYSIKIDSEPVIVVTDHAVGSSLPFGSFPTHTLPQRLVYYDLDPTGRLIQPTFTSISSTIDAISTGKVHPKHSENYIERIARVCPSSSSYLLISNPAI
jgi:thioredoxin domain-containing protein 5